MWMLERGLGSQWNFPKPYCTFHCRLQTVIKQKDARTTHTHTHIKAHIVIIILYVPFFCARLHARRVQSEREKKVTLVIIRRSDAVWMMMCYSGPRVTSTNINTSRREASAHRMWTTAAERYYMRERLSSLSPIYIYIQNAHTLRRKQCARERVRPEETAGAIADSGR